MSKSISMIGYNKASIEIYLSQLKENFNDRLIIDSRIVDEIKEDSIIYSDIIILTSYCLYSKVKKNLCESSKIIIIERTITKNSYDKIQSLPGKHQLYLIDQTESMASEISFIINRLSNGKINLMPLSLDSIEKNNLEFCVSMGVQIPGKIKDTLDIGYSFMSVGTIIEIGFEAGLEESLTDKDVVSANNHIISYNYNSFNKFINKINRLKGRFKSFFDYFEEGYIILDINNTIEECNKKAIELLRLKPKDFECLDLSKLLSEELFQKVFQEIQTVKDEILHIEDLTLILSIYPTVNSGKYYGTTLIIKEFNVSEKRQNEIRKKLMGKGHKAKYIFNDIVGESNIIKECIERAKRMALSNSSILIEGETGTGKELFAQAIHNHSSRKNHQFVAINLGALPTNILESELFGYEEGAFTGAKKGGKPGLFELAHGGTIFLDEIGEMPIELQSKLLRVLQEKEVMRLGSDKIISIDIRVIAATNKDLIQQVNNNTFRKDLFYRIKVLSLKIPPLRYRKEDIFVLLDYFKIYFQGEFNIDNQVREMLLNMQWQGNVRELRNYVEFLINIGKKDISSNDLPLENFESSFNKEEMLDNDSLNILIDKAGVEKDKYITILKILYVAYDK